MTGSFLEGFWRAGSGSFLEGFWGAGSGSENLKDFGMLGSKEYILCLMESS